MIVFASTATHAWTHAPVQKAAPWFRRVAYPWLLSRRTLPRATYIFADLDRLSRWQLELAAHAARVLREDGCRVLNDPARALHRLELLRKLHRLGLNSFQAWPAAEADTVDRFPVFLRTAAGHRGVIGGLLHDAQALLSALAELLAQGWPISDLMVVEYRAEPLHTDVFRKLAMFRIGDTYAPTLSVHERSWVAKFGEEGVAGEAAYAADLEQVRTAPFAAEVRRAFEAADIEYGRADYSLVAGRVEVYEINTNPTIGAPTGPFGFPQRQAAAELGWALMLEGFRSVDSPTARGRVRVPRHAHFHGRKIRRLSPAYLWTP